MKFELKDYHQSVSDQELIDDIKRVANELDQEYLTVVQYDRLGNFNASTAKRRFGSWIKSIEAAGLKKSKGQKNKKIKVEDLFENLEEVWIKLGRQPRKTEMFAPLSKFSADTYKRRFGSWMKALESFVDFMTNEGKLYTEEAIKKVAVEPKSKHKTQRTVNWRLRFLVMKRDNFKCCYCGRSPASDPEIVLNVDHIKPWSKGGESVLENLQTLCSVCNIGKSNLE